MAIIALDVDDVCLDLVPTWLSLYNLEFDDNLQKEQILDSDIAKYVKPEAKEKILEYIDQEDVYYGSLPVPGVLEGIKKLRELGHRVVFVTASNPNNCKFNWLKDHGFLDNKKDFVMAYDKSLIRGDILIDDRYENCRDFKGMGILFTQTWNTQYTDYPNRIDDWEAFMRILE